MLGYLLVRLFLQSNLLGGKAKGKTSAKTKFLDDVKNLPTSLPISIPECLICMEEMSPPTRIVQCLKGHKICEPCSQREEGMFCPGHCKTGFTGFRDFGMEAFILKMTDEVQGLRASGSSKSK